MKLFSKHALRVNSVHDQPGYPPFTADCSCNGREWEIYNVNTLGVSLICLGTATAVSMLIGLVYVLMNKTDSTRALSL